MMRASWDFKKADEIIASNSRKRLIRATNYLAEKVRRATPTGTTIRPIYKTGPHAGQKWTGRDGGQLKKSVRVVEWDEDKYALAQFKSIGNYRDVRVYVGHYLAYYADIVEYATPFMRPTIEATKIEVKNILENG